MAEPERIVDLLRVVSDIATDKISTIKQVTAASRILALNALVEANRAGAAGRGFAVVANEVKSISVRISRITQELEAELSTNIEELSRLGEAMVMRLRSRSMSLIFSPTTSEGIRRPPYRPSAISNFHSSLGALSITRSMASRET